MSQTTRAISTTPRKRKHGLSLRGQLVDGRQTENLNVNMGRGLTMIDAAVYARYSTDLQSDLSIDRQNFDADRYAERTKLNITTRYHDAAKSSATMFDRPGLDALLKAARAGAFKAVIVESLDRLAGHPADLHAIHRLFELVDVTIHCTNGEGVANDFMITLRGLYGKIRLKDIADKVRGAHREKASRGLFPGTPPYGYRLVRNKDGEPEAEVDPAQAVIVVRIFVDYAAGKSPRTIALELNAEGIPSPTGGRWNFQGLIGGGNSRYGILSNPLYIGELFWGRDLRKRSDTTGAKLKRRAPAEHVVHKQLPHLRIIEQPLWDAAQKIRAGRAQQLFGPAGKVIRKTPFLARSEHLLAGLVECGICGSPMRIRSATRGVAYAACTAAERYGTCDHNRTYDLNHMQVEVLYRMRQRLTDPVLLKEGFQALQARHVDRQKQNRLDAASVRKELSRVEMSISRLVAAITASNRPIAALTEELEALENRRVGLERRKTTVEAETNVVTLHPTAAQSYIRAVEDFCRNPEGHPRTTFKTLVGSIVVHPLEGNTAHRGGKRRPYEFELFGRMGAMLGGIDLLAAGRSPEKILEEHGVDCATASDQGTPVGRYSTDLVPLGRWRAAA